MMPGVPAHRATPLDLHLHTRCSDGDKTPAEVARRCLAAGLRAAAVTDHNTMAGVAGFARAAGGALTVVPGCEVTAEWRGKEVHCLAYFTDPADRLIQLFQHRIRRVHDAELDWWRAWTERARAIGVPLTWDLVSERLGGDRVAYVGDYLALLAGTAGDDPRFTPYAPASYDRIAADWCRPGQPLHVPQPWRPGLLDVLTWIGEAGGAAVLAHPAGVLDASDDEECTTLLKPLCEAGLSGLEAWTSWHTPAESSRLARICAALGLVATAGSDYHGTRVKSWVPGPGLLPAPPADPMAILDALHDRAAATASGGSYVTAGPPPTATLHVSHAQEGPMTSATAHDHGRAAADPAGPAPFAERAWHLVPVVVLRQAGFPMELLAPLADTAAAAEADALMELRARLAALADDVKDLLREHQVPGRQRMASWVGQLRPVPEAELAEALAGPPGDGRVADALRAYRETAARLAADWSSFAARHRERLDAAGFAVARAFTDDPALRDVLLLSNDAAYPGFAAWLDSFAGDAGRHTRKMTDLLAMYLQRVTTKNETHAHFGPFTVGRTAPGCAPGITWSSSSPQPLERRSCFTHWAAERLAAAAGETPGLADCVRPRRRPLAFLRDGRIDLYAFTTRDGLDTDWDFRHLGGGAVSTGEAWLWEQCDGERTVGELRTAWDARYGPGADAGLDVDADFNADADFDADADAATAAESGVGPGTGTPSFDRALRRLTEHEWVIAEFEIPVGDSRPLAALRDLLSAAPGGLARPLLAATERFEQDLARFSALSPEERPALLADAKDRFEKLTRVPANRHRGLHYADRSILFEEAHSGLAGLTVGPDVARFITDELSVVYETVLAGPRLRMRRESAILTRWAAARFGTGTAVPLDRLYAEFFRDRERLAAECATVDAELAVLDAEITHALLGDDTGRAETVVPRERLEAVLGAHPATPPAVCNPDVLFAAESREALARGDFTAVIGDCHAVREVVTHTSFGPLVQERAPELLPEVYRGYLSLLDDDEILVNLSRGHPDKSSTQLCYPCHDLEVYGRSPQTRDKVLQPSQLYVVVTGGRLELRARGVDGRLRLMAPPAGGPSILQDPLSPFAFPRHFGGVGLRAEALEHIPRIRCGRVVLQRETWRIPAAALRGTALSGSRTAADDAAEFLSARRLRTGHGLPRHVFAKVPGEPKPLYVDWDAPLLVRQLSRLARRTGGTVEISEMLPAPDRRWLEVGGRRYTSELRCAVFSPGRPR
ncbi:lantibiotic dehydratase [Streptomyces roseifaciens]